jgi:hypothetical protein
MKWPKPVKKAVETAVAQLADGLPPFKWFKTKSGVLVRRRERPLTLQELEREESERREREWEDGINAATEPERWIPQTDSSWFTTARQRDRWTARTWLDRRP